MWQAFQQNREVLGAKNVAVSRRLATMHMLVMSAGLWAIETMSPSSSLYDPLEKCYLDICMAACGWRYKTGVSYALWVGAWRGRMRGLIASNGGGFTTNALSRYWRYAGHVCRGSAGDECVSLISFRGYDFCLEQASKHERDRVKCRKGGQQRPVYDRLLVGFLGRGYGGEAKDRGAWKQLEEEFITYAMGNL